VSDRLISLIEIFTNVYKYQKYINLKVKSKSFDIETQSDKNQLEMLQQYFLLGLLLFWKSVYSVPDRFSAVGACLNIRAYLQVLLRPVFLFQMYLCPQLFYTEQKVALLLIFILAGKNYLTSILAFKLT
jgi:hypothetical protein